MGGYRLIRGGGQASYEKRKVSIITCPLSKRYDLTVQFPVAEAATGMAAAPVAGAAPARRDRRGVNRRRGANRRASVR